jgi:23S rRNA pseudouridine2605 synthase
MAEERLQRALARAGFGSRRACEELIARGGVRVNGRTATLGDKVDPLRDRVTLDGAPVNLDPEVRYLKLNKPAGIVTTMRDQRGRADIRAFLPSEGPRVFPVGRLDRRSEGLLLLTNDGELANRLLHPSYQIEKEYLAEVSGTPSPAQLSRVRTGVELDDGPARARSVRLVDARRERGQVSIVMTEGRKREVRRLLAAVGLPVTRLVRVRIGPVRLGRLKPGERRELAADELLELQRVIAKAERRAHRVAATHTSRPPVSSM